LNASWQSNHTGGILGYREKLLTASEYYRDIYTGTPNNHVEYISFAQSYGDYVRKQVLDRLSELEKEAENLRHEYSLELAQVERHKAKAEEIATSNKELDARAAEYSETLKRGKFKRTLKGIWYLIKYPAIRQSCFCSYNHPKR
jgi:hypothetical protein